jgi:hypothetical protein
MWRRFMAIRQARVCFRDGLGRDKNFADRASVETPVGELPA